MRKLYSALLTLILLVGTAQFTLAAPTPGETLLEANIYNVGDSLYYLSYNGVPQEVNPTYHSAPDNNDILTQWPAYCIEPSKLGVHDVGAYSVKTSEYITDPKVVGIITNGYPYKSIGELGLSTRAQAYYATKVALWAYLRTMNINNFTATTPEQTQTLAAMKTIYTAGMATTEIKNPVVTITPDQPKAVTDTNPAYVSQTFSVTANTEILSYEVTLPGEAPLAPVGSFIADLNGNAKSRFLPNEKFKVMIPADAISGMSGNFAPEVTGEVRIDAVIYGLSYEPDTQDYAVTRDPFGFKATSVTVNYSSQNTMLEIIKMADGTNTPLPGAVFRVSGPGQMGTFTTDGSGRVVVPLTESGIYSVDEITPPAGYELAEITHRDVNVAWDQVATLTFTNKRLPGLSLLKIDTDTGQPLPGAVLRVASAGGLQSTDVTTGFAGTANLPNLSPGTYTVTEIAAPDGYILDNSPQTVILEAGKITAVTLTNRKKPVLIIKKYDEGTMLPLAGAEFSVALKGGSTVYEGITDASGVIRIEDLSEDWYTVTEIAAPAGYLKATESKDVFLPAGKIVEIKFDNRLRPALKLVKLDEQTDEPLAGAKFSVQKTEGGTVSEYTTGKDGTVTINNLDEAIYSVWEIKAPDGYLLDPQHKDIQLAWGEEKQLIFTDKARPVLEITKLDAVSRKPLAGVKFRVTKTEGNTTSDYMTGTDGKIVIKNLDTAVYTVEEISVPDSHILSPGKQTIELEWGKTKALIYENDKKPRLTITKVDDVTKSLLPGAVFNIAIKNGLNIGDFTTDSKGEIVLERLDPALYVITEVKAPDGYAITNAPQDLQLVPNGDHQIDFRDKALSPIYVKKVDAKTGNPLMGASYRVTKMNGEFVGEITTDRYGFAAIPRLDPGYYTVTEIFVPAGYVLDETPKSVEVRLGEPAIIEFADKPFGNLIIKKVDDKTGAALADTDFSVTKIDGAFIGDYTTDAQGSITIPSLEPGFYVVRETRVQAGYLLDSTPKNIEVKWGQAAEITFRNKAMSGVQIIKIDAVSKQPLKDAKFTIYRKSGEIVGNYGTNGDGVIILDNLSPGWYKVAETKAPDGYMIDDTPQDFEVMANQFIKLTFENKQISSLQIRKESSVDGTPLAGAVFEVRKQSGEYVGEYTTDKNGAVNIPGTAPGWYIVSEIQAPVGFILDNAVKTVEVKPVTPTIVTFADKPLAGLQIIKLDSATRQPIEGVEFSIAKMDGERVGAFATDKAGTIYVSMLVPAWYTVTETKAADGYILNAEPQNVEISWGKSVTLEVLNTPMSGLIIVKTDGATGKPLAGVVFDIKRADGQFVIGTILDGNQPGTENNSPNNSFGENGNVTGSYTTDANGRIQINGLDAGQYMVVERQTLDGYELDTEVHTVTVTPGNLATLQLTNSQKAGLRLLKIDSFTKKPIEGVEFMVFDTNNKAQGTYLTDNNGVIDFEGVLTPGRYTIRETRAADGYYRDDMPRTVDFKSGKVTEVVWENTPEMGQLQIMKKSGDANEVNGLEAGTPLAGAVFEIYAYKSGNLIDRFVSGADGRAVSKPLPLGRYTVKEVQAPKWYKLSTETMDIEIEFPTQIIKRDFLNYSANTGVTIRKIGNYEAMPGDTIRYDIKEVRNDSTVSLTDFFWRDMLPTDAVRLSKIVTGTYNQSLKYKILATTNKGDTRVIADNLSTTQNNIIDCSRASLGMTNDEYITNFTFVFGTVKAGFTKVTAPQVYVTVNKNLPNGYEFANKCDVGGKYGSEWVIGNSVWATKIYAQPVKLPRTGY